MFFPMLFSANRRIRLTNGSPSRTGPRSTDAYVPSHDNFAPICHGIRYPNQTLCLISGCKQEGDHRSR